MVTVSNVGIDTMIEAIKIIATVLSTLRTFSSSENLHFLDVSEVPRICCDLGFFRISRFGLGFPRYEK